MKIRDLKKRLENEDDDREIVLHVWSGRGSAYVKLRPSPNPYANSKNLFVLIDAHALVKPIMEDKKITEE